MTMTAEEIVRHYRQAANKTKDIGVLAELNATDEASIKAVLIDAGVMEPERKERKKPRPKKKETMELAAPERPPIKREKGKPNVNTRIAAILAAIPEEAPDSVKAKAVDLCKEMMKFAEL